MGVDEPLDLMVSILALITIGLYIWSTWSHFRSDTQPAGVSFVAVTVLASFTIYLLLLWSNVQPAPAQWAGLAIILLSLALFWWAIVTSRGFGLTHVFDKTKPTALLSSGPYAYVRHPFYASYIIFWAGLALSTWNVLALAPLIIVILIYTKAARLEEGKFSSSPLNDQYIAYRKQAGMFWPKAWPH